MESTSEIPDDFVENFFDDLEENVTQSNKIELGHF